MYTLHFKRGETDAVWHFDSLDELRSVAVAHTRAGEIEPLTITDDAGTVVSTEQEIKAAAAEPEVGG